MAVLYPDFPRYSNINPNDADRLYADILSWAGELKHVLEIRDSEVDAGPALRVYRVASITSIGNPNEGDVSYSTSTSKFRGYVDTTTGWVDFN